MHKKEQWLVQALNGDTWTTESICNSSFEAGLVAKGYRANLTMPIRVIHQLSKNTTLSNV